MSRAVRVPRVVISVDGRPLDPAVLAAVRQVTVAQRANLPDQVELVVDELSGLWPPGAALRVQVDGDTAPLFTGEVVATEHVYGPDGRRTLHVRGYDALHQLRLRHDVAVHGEVTLGALAERWADELQLRTSITADGPELERVVQRGESALGILQALSERTGVLFHLADRTLSVFGQDGDGQEVTLRWGTTLREARLDRNASATDRAVRVDAWDPLSAATVTGNVDGSGPQVAVAGAVASTADEAHALARAHAHRRARTATALWAVADGDPRLRPGTVVALEGDDTLRSRHLLTSVTHRVDDRCGFSSELSTTLGPPPDASPLDLQLATVVDVADPAGRGRVAVTVDALDAVVTSWLQVVVPGAGPGKGVVALPDVGDRVLVAAPGGDVGRGLVLGGLFGAQGAFDPGVVDGAVRRHSWRTAGGQLVCLDDDQRRLRLEDETGSFVELAPERVLIHAATDLTLEAPGRAITVIAASVDFEEG